MADDLSVQGLVGGIYDYCGNPPQDKISRSMVLNSLFDKIRHYKNELDITNEAWRLEKTRIEVQRDKFDYKITAPDFGRPFLVQTHDSNRLINVREIEIVRPQDVDQKTQVLVEGEYQLRHSAACFTFRNIGTPDPSFQVFPIPKQAAEYLIWHESVDTQNPLYSEIPNFLKNFFPLIKLDVCIDVMPFSGFPMDIIQKVIEVRTAAKMQAYDVFANYIQEAFHEQAGHMRATNSSRRGGGNSYW